jgi:CMP-N,N'-diacetyllegionaminic acid synthase
MILGTICVRAGSKGIPGKSLKLLHGKPLIDYTTDCVRRLSMPRDITIRNWIASTDDDQVGKYAEARGITILSRPPELATDTASKWDVFRHIASSKHLDANDILVDLDIGCPLRSPDDVTACIEKLELNPDFDVITTAYPAERNPYFNMVELRPTGQADIVKDVYDYSKAITRRQDAPVVWSLSPSVFAIRVKALYNYSHWSQSLFSIVEIPRVRGIDIDTQDDWDYAEYLVGRQ